MASFKSTLNWVYVVLIAAQIIGMFVIDFLYFYPPSLWQAPTAPLHFLLQFRHFYHSMTGDPYLVLPSPYHFWDAFAVVELFTQLPLGVYFVYKVLSKSGVVDGPTELAGLAFACLNTMGSYVGCHDVWNMPPHLITAEAKNKVIFGEFGPYAVMSAVFAVDMYTRLLRRLDTPGKAKSQ